MLPEITQKKCRKCNRILNLDDFHKSKTGKNGLHSKCKECVRSYHAEHADRLLQKTKQWKISNPEKAESLRLRHVDNVRRLAALWAKDYPEKNRCKALAWAKNNPDKHIAKANKRRVRKQNAEGSHTVEEWNNLCASYDNICLCCKRKTRLCRDHVIPLTCGGSDYITNIQPLCRACNSRKGSQTIDYRASIKECA